MRYLTGEEKKEALFYLFEAANIAEQSSCYRSKCGSVLVKEDHIIGVGFNSPPLNETLKYCLKDSLTVNFKSDKTCCIHAEQRSINEALKNFPEKIFGSRMYFTRIDQNNQPVRSGKPYCTMCSKMSLDVGVSEWVLWHDEGICLYDSREYNLLSFQFRM